jgi:serine/threonine protein kinase/tetratricopeptide (TPR) repeat protein
MAKSKNVATSPIVEEPKTMNPDRYDRIMEIVDVLMDCAPAEIDARLEQECAGDESLRAEVEKLLAEDRPASRFLEDSPLDALSSLPAALGEDQLIGEQIGSYRITQEIGRGGMGAVYKAVRADDQYHTEVAIKLIKRGMDTDSVLRRFRNERQILANLNHPNIARLLDGGSTEGGLPYFVMEYIEGQPITEYCDQHKLTTNQRLELFRSVCAALSYAHRNLVIHRDLKPSNILVTKEGAPKLLDFGIAKLLHATTDETMTAATATELRAMTPEYASPEQVKGEPITTSSDVYSLGVLLYELLTGHRPYHFATRRPEEVARVINEVEPERPSTAVSRIVETQTTNSDGRNSITPESVSQVREGEPEKLRRRLRGDLDNIALKALRKQPERRYSSVEQFSEDIRHHLAGLPVIARKDTLSYRTQKFVQRHRGGVVAAALVLIALIAGMTTTVWQARVAQRQRAIAERRFNDVRRLANSFMFEFHDEIDKGPLKAKELLVRKAIEYLDSLSTEAGNDPGLQRELATAYSRIALIQGGGLLSNLNDPKGAVESQRKALAIRERLAALEPANADIRYEMAASNNAIGESIAIPLAKPGEALEYFRKAQTILEPLVAANPNRREFRRELASVYRAIAEATNNMTDASVEERNNGRELQLKGVALYEALAAEDPKDLEVHRRLAGSYATLGIRKNGEGNIAESAEYFRKAQAVDETLIAAEPSNISYRRESAVTLSNLGVALLKRGDKLGALDHARKALKLYQELAEADKNDANARKDLAIGYRNLGQASLEAGDKVGASEPYLKSISVFEDLVAKEPNNAYNRRQLALTYLRMSQLMSSTNDFARGIDYARQAIGIGEKLTAADAKNLSVLRTLADSYFQLGKCHAQLGAKAGKPPGQQKGWPEARSWYQKSLDIWLDMKAKGTLAGADKTKLEEVEREIASGTEKK